jgi:hypothetical protein
MNSKSGNTLDQSAVFKILEEAGSQYKQYAELVDLGLESQLSDRGSFGASGYGEFCFDRGVSNSFVIE